MPKYITTLDVSKQNGHADLSILAATDILAIDETIAMKRTLKIGGTADAAMTLRFPRLSTDEAGMFWIIQNTVAQTLTCKAIATVDANGDPATYTTGNTAIAASKHAVVYWNGADFVKIAELA